MISTRSFFPSVRAAWFAGIAAAGLCVAASAQVPQTPQQTPVSSDTQTSKDGKVTTTTTTSTDANGKPVQSVSSTMTFGRGKKKKAAAQDAKPEKTVQTKDTRKALRNEHKVESLAGVDAKLPDKALFDKAVIAMNKGHYDVARLDLQTMLNTYPDSQYQMRAKLAIADSWYKEGGTAALTQAESEYRDFTVFFPNAPEAAEAQMRIGDIYFRQMDRPDRDYAKALHSEEEYRRMLTDYSESTLVPQAKQRLRDVQEVLATREADIASYYATRDNYAAVIARYQTVVDTYPLYSHIDDVLIGLGDAYEAQGRYVRTMKLPEAGKARLEELYDGQAADMYRKVVLEHSAAPHAEDAKDRLAAMNLPIPTPTPEQLAASTALENSRSSYRISDHLALLFLHKPDTVLAPHTGQPTLVDPKMTVAPAIVKKANEEFRAAFAADAPPAARAPEGAAPAVVAPVAAAPAVSAAPLAFEEVPTSGSGGGGSATGATSLTASPSGRTTSTGTGMNVEIITHPAADPNATPAPPGSAPGPDPGLSPLKAVGPSHANDPLPAAEKAASAPDVANEAAGMTTAPAQTPPAKGKAGKAPLDKADESSSKTKKKKGINKINPF